MNNITSIDRISEALSFVPPHDRDMWVRMAMAIKSELGDAGFDIWDTWSQASESYKSRDARDVWKSIGSNGAITIATLFHTAKTSGWQEKGEYYSPTTEEKEERKRKAVEAAAEEKEKIDQERAKTASLAKKIWKKSRPVGPNNPYLLRKGISSVSTMKEISAEEAVSILGYAPQSRGELLTGVLLVIPIKARNKLSTVELIDGDGRKTALFGRGSKTNGYWASRSLPIEDSKDLTLLIGEGVATVLSAEECAGYLGIAALSSNNLLPVANAIRECYPVASLIILADLLKATGEPDPHAIKAAQTIGGRLAIPNFGSNRAPNDTDFNDLKLLLGSDTVKDAIANATEPTIVELCEGDKHLSNTQQKIVEVVRACDVLPEPIAWLWNGWIAAGKMHILGGAPGTGKTTISMALVATITCGGRWPDRTPCAVGSVLIWSGEDDPKDTLTPRLIQAGADLSKVYFITGIQDGKKQRAFDPALDMELLHSKIIEIGEVRLLIVDPIVSAIVGDSHKNAEVRRGLQPLVDLAASMRFALLGITHFSKGTGGREPVERLTGSLAFGALARVVLVAAKQQKDDGDGCAVRLFLRAKSNIGPDDGGFEYDLQQAELNSYPGVFTSYVLWGKYVAGSARDLLTIAESTEADSKENIFAETKRFLSELLANGPLPMKQIEDQVKGAGYSMSTIKRAKRSLDIISFKESGEIGEKGKQWFWKLPGQDSSKESIEVDLSKEINDTEETQQNNVSLFDEIDPLRENSEFVEIEI